uniref:ARAD1D30096p n=1 Tax=Blastobotrys adeninivorans TaxID=409370 RepID=A0A060THD7_BLAAD
MATDQVTEKVGQLDLNDGLSPTVFKSTDDFTVTHPLSHKWTLWYTRPPVNSKEDWKNLLKEIVTVSTVEEFWGMFNSIPKVDELQLRSDYSFFRDGIRPEWEDQANGAGGKIVYVLPHKRSQNAITADEAWLKTLLGVIGGTLDNDTGMITGVFINVRRAGTRVNIWTSKTRPEDQLKAIAQKFKELLQLGRNDEVEFTAHDSSNKKDNWII